MYVSVADRKFDEIKKVFGRLSTNQMFLVTALALERLWTPFELGVLKSHFSGDETKELLRIGKQCLNMVWDRVQKDKTPPNYWEKYNELYDRFNEIADDDTYGAAELDVDALYFDGSIQEAAWWYFKEHDCTSEIKNLTESLAGITCRVLDLVMDGVLDTLAEAEPGILYHNREKCNEILEQHPTVLDELSRLDSDIELAKKCQGKSDEIQDLRVKYHNLSLNDIGPPEDYGFRIN